MPSARSPRISHKTLIRWQARSGMVFAAFLVVHLLNLWIAVSGQVSFDGFQRSARAVYQFPLIEIVGVLGSATVHIVVSLMRVRRRRAAQEERAQVSATPWRMRLHRYSAYFLLAVLAGHVLATRLPTLLGHTVDHSFLTFSLQKLPYVFYPYYALLSVSGLYHMSHGLLLALRVHKLKLPGWLMDRRSTAFWGAMLTGAVVCTFGVLALGGVLRPVNTARFGEWQSLVDSLLP